MNKIKQTINPKETSQNKKKNNDKNYGFGDIKEVYIRHFTSLNRKTGMAIK